MEAGSSGGIGIFTINLYNFIIFILNDLKKKKNTTDRFPDRNFPWKCHNHRRLY